MPITINGSGTVTGISAGGLPDASIVTADIADANITAAKLSGAQSGSAPIYGARAFVNFDGTKDTTGATSTANTNRLIRASGNVTSVLRNGTGDYTITFTTAMPDANFTAVATLGLVGTGAGSGPVAMFAENIAGSSTDIAPTTTTVRFNTFTYGGAIQDISRICVAIFR